MQKSLDEKKALVSFIESKYPDAILPLNFEYWFPLSEYKFPLKIKSRVVNTQYVNWMFDDVDGLNMYLVQHIKYMNVVICVYSIPKKISIIKSVYHNHKYEYKFSNFGKDLKGKGVDMKPELLSAIKMQIIEFARNNEALDLDTMNPQLKKLLAFI